MRVWRIRLEEYVPDTITRGFALKAVTERPRSAMAVLGHYIEAYEKRFHRRWPFTGVQTRLDYDDLLLLVRRVGVDEATRAVAVIFGPKFKWLNGRYSRFLANRDAYGNHVVPVLSEQQSGEQAEWSGARTSGAQEVSL